MARRTFDVIDVVEILQDWHAGRSKTDVAASVGVDRGNGTQVCGPLLRLRVWFRAVRL